MAKAKPKLMWISSQIEAREHYAIPRMLYKNNQLDSVYTDFWCKNLRPIVSRMPKPLNSMKSRYHEDLKHARVFAQNPSSLLWKIRQKKYKNPYLYFFERGKSFSENLRTQLKRCDLSHINHFFAYDTGFFEAAEYCKSQGIKTVLGQMDPGIIEQDIIYAERQKWPGWENNCTPVPKLYNDRRKMEWDSADVIVVNSKWSHDALIQQGVKANKIKIIPLAYENPSPHHQQSANNNLPSKRLRILWLGSVILRKGIQYLIEAAKSLPEIDFTIAGPIIINPKVVEQAPKNMIFLGKVERSTTSQLYQSHDVFILPTLSDGFAITQIEALAHGLPVITTDKCGDVISHGIDGLIIESASSHAIKEAIFQLDKNREDLFKFQRNTLKKSKKFSLDRLYDYYQEL